MNHTKRNTITCITRARLIFVLLNIFFLIIFTFNVFAQDYIEYKIKEGDCLWTIAQKFQLSIQDVTEENDIEQDQILSPGLLIKIPQNKRDDSTKNEDSPTVIHTVQKGESLWNIAQQYHLSLDCISSANNLKELDSLSIGQELKIPIDKNQTGEGKEKDELFFEDEASKFQGISTSLNQEFRDTVKEIDYAVKPGENLWTIAQNYQVSLNDLSQVNDLENAEKLSIGQIIKIPLGTGSKSKDEVVDKGDGSKIEPQENWLEHIVEYGENISTIAQKYHMPIETICQLNQISQKDYVYPGQRLKIKPNYPGAIELKSTGDNGQQNKDSQKNNVSSEEESQPVYYTVASGDTLWTIAQHHSVSMESILAVNYLNNKDVLSVGQKLEIPAIGGADKNKDDIQMVEYKVVKGDTLWNIAQKFDVRMHEIISVNQLQSIGQLSVGQKLDIPTSGIALEQETEKTTTVAQEETPEDVVHYVQKGETLWNISRKYQVSLQSITSANNISENSRIVVGQRLVIPNVRNSRISSYSYIWPVNGLITSQFGIRTLGGRRDYHTGIDIDGRTGTSIKAVESGKVSFSGYINGYGNAVIIEHANGYSTVYAHNSSNLVKEGQNVSKGDIIARLGASGNATGSHLHFEIRENGKPVNPLNYLP